MPGDGKKHLKPCMCVQINTQWSSRGTEPTFYQDSHFVGVLQSFQYISGVFFVCFILHSIYCVFAAVFYQTARNM